MKLWDKTLKKFTTEGSLINCRTGGLDWEEKKKTKEKVQTTEEE